MTLNITFSEVELTRTESIGQEEIVSSQQPSSEQDIGVGSGSSGPDTNGESGGFNNDVDSSEGRVTEL